MDGGQVSECAPASRNAKRDAKRAGRQKKRELIIALIMSTALIAVSTSEFPAFAQSRSAATASFNIQPQPMSQALVAFSSATGIQLFFNADLVRGVNSPGVQGSFNRTEALSRLLAGSGLTYRFTNANTVAISGPSTGTTIPARPSMARSGSIPSRCRAAEVLQRMRHFRRPARSTTSPEKR